MGETDCKWGFTQEDVRKLRKVIVEHDNLVLAIPRFNDFLTRYDEREKIQLQQHRDNSEKLEKINVNTAKKAMWATIIGVVWTFVGVIVSIIAILVAVKVAHAGVHSVIPILKSTIPSLS